MTTGLWTYPAELREALAGLGLAPTDRIPPAVVRDAANDLYRYELRRLRDRYRAGEMTRSSFLDRVVWLRKKYWVLTLPLSAWVRICSTTSSPSSP
jgi:hypothetical protein